MKVSTALLSNILLATTILAAPARSTLEDRIAARKGRRAENGRTSGLPIPAVPNDGNGLPISNHTD